jgi:chemotaxis protein histidine kinase CheA
VAEQDRLHADFADLWPASQERIEAALEALERGVAALEAGELDEELRADARNGAHKLVGTLGTYGLLGAAELARALERVFDDPPVASTGVRPTLTDLVERVRAAST